MKRRGSFARFVLGLSAVIFLIGCGSPANPRPPKWTAENPNAAPRVAGRPAAAAPVSAPVSVASAPMANSSLEALRKGEMAAPGPMQEVHFNFDSAELSEEARATLKANAEWLKVHANAKVQIEGHCDERGTAEYNMALGAKRAHSAMEYLKTLGITVTRMSTISYGEEVPACKQGSEPCWEQNRRARFVVTDAKPIS